MADLLVRVADKLNEDFYLNTKCTKRGDVIAVRPDGWQWGKDETALPFWRILRLANVSEAEASAMLAPQLDTDPASPSKTLLRRAFRLDLDAMAQSDPALAAYLADDKRALPAFKADAIFTSDFRAAKVQKPTVADPAVIGSDPNVIG